MSAGALYYRCKFSLPDTAGRRFWLEFEGVAGTAQVWVNGHWLCVHRDPYTPILAEVTALLRPGENEVMLHCDARAKPDSRWYVGCGLYRPVFLWEGAPPRPPCRCNNGFRRARPARFREATAAF